MEKPFIVEKVADIFKMGKEERAMLMTVTLKMVELKKERLNENWQKRHPDCKPFGTDLALFNKYMNLVKDERSDFLYLMLTKFQLIQHLRDPWAFTITINDALSIIADEADKIEDEGNLQKIGGLWSGLYQTIIAMNKLPIHDYIPILIVYYSKLINCPHTAELRRKVRVPTRLPPLKRY
jgi:hypothetical protein